MELLTWDFDPYCMETWFLFIATDGSYTNHVYRHTATRERGPLGEVTFTPYTEKDPDEIRRACTAVSEGEIDAFRKTVSARGSR